MVPKPDRTLAIVISVCTSVITLTLVTTIILFKPWANKNESQDAVTEVVEEENTVPQEDAVDESETSDTEDEPLAEEAVEEYFDWKTAYTDYITNNDLSSHKYALICLDEDRKFKDARLQAYFDARSWYKGTIEPDKFKDDVLNATEKENALNFSEWEQYLKDEGLDTMR